MRKQDILAIDGVFLAVKCAICETVYPADSDDFVAFYGSVTVGLEGVILGVSPPRRPAKKALAAVCRTPQCLEGLVKSMLGCDGEKGDAAELWKQVLRNWAEDAGSELEGDEPGEALQPKAKLKAKAKGKE